MICEKYSDASTTSGDSSIASTRSTGCTSADASVTPLPNPMIATARGRSCSNSGRCASDFCVSMSSDVEASTFPSMAREMRAVEPFDRNRAGGAFAVVEQRSGSERGGARPACILAILAGQRIGASSEQFVIPSRDRDHHREPRRRGCGDDDALAYATQLRRQRTRSRRRSVTMPRCAWCARGRRAGIVRNPAAERPDRSHRVNAIRRPHPPCVGFGAAARETERQRECKAEHQRCPA